jgi:dynein heavy chain
MLQCGSKSDDAHACLQTMIQLVGQYRGMGPLLRKVEEAVCGTNEGRAPKLAPYYAHWERAVFQALNAMVMGGMGTKPPF